MIILCIDIILSIQRSHSIIQIKTDGHTFHSRLNDKIDDGSRCLQPKFNTGIINVLYTHNLIWSQGNDIGL